MSAGPVHQRYEHASHADRTGAQNRSAAQEASRRSALPNGSAQPSLPSFREEATLPAGSVDRFVAAVRLKDELPSRTLIARLLEQGYAPSTLLMELITPAAREFGRMWEEDTCDFFEVTLASGRLQTLIHELRDELNRRGAPSGRTALLCGLPGEDHTLGLSILAEFFTLHGWSVTVGPPFLDADPAELASQAWYDVIGFSVARDEALIPLKHFVSRTRKRSLNSSATIIVGGRAIDADPATVELVGADAGGVAAVEAVRSATSLKNREKE